MTTKRVNPGADWDISIDGKMRTHRDTKEYARDAGLYLKKKNPNASVTVMNRVTGEILKLEDASVAWADRR